MKRNALLWIALGGALAGALAGCDGSTTKNEPQQIQNKVTLTNFDSCPALETYIEDNYVKQMQDSIDQQKAYGYGYWYGPGRGIEDSQAAPSANAAGGSGSKSSSPTSYTTTNTQVKGVDEADFMKNDGTRIFTLSGNSLFATQSWPPQDIKSAGQIAIEGWPQSMFLDEKNRITVFSSVWLTDPEANLGKTESDPDYCYYCYSGVSATKVTVVDVSDMANMKVTSELYYPGYMTDARRIGSSVRVVVGDYFNWPDGVSYWPEYDPNDPNKYNDKAVFDAALDKLKVSNEQAIRGKDLNFWLKKGKRRTADGKLVDIGYNCSDFTQMNAPTKLTGLLNIITVNLDKLEDQGHRLTLLGEMGTVYASTKSLYVAEWHWWWGWWNPGQQNAAYIHKFDITNPDKAIYQASGAMVGHINDQFSLDEYNDNLRVAHTIDTWEADPTATKDQPWLGTWKTTNRVTVFSQTKQSLIEVGTTGDLAEGERIQSSRFIGEKGFVVTFRQVDPLFTIDLKNPTSPKVVGTLKVPGFSSYIHPLDENHLLTIGVYIPEPTDPNQPTNWQERRQQLAIFDVSDFANPVQTFTLTSGTAYGWSEAQWDHHAFNYFPERGLLAVPFSDYSTTYCSGTDVNCWDGYWSSFISEVRVFKIDTKTGIEFKGALSMADVYKSYGTADWQYYYSPWIRRSVMASDADGKDFVYAISDAGVRVANLQTLETLGTAEFGPPTTGSGTSSSDGTGTK